MSRGSIRTGVLLVSILSFAGGFTSALATQHSQEPLAGVAQQIPEFGGAYVDRDTAKLYIWLTDPGESVVRRAHDAVNEVLGAEIGSYHAVVLPAKYSFLQLMAWQAGFSRDAGSLPGVVFDDADERLNRLTVAVGDVSRDGPEVEAAIARLGIPRAAVRIVRHAPIVQAPDSSHTPIVILAVLIVVLTSAGTWVGRSLQRRRRVATQTTSNRSSVGFAQEPSKSR